MAGSRLELVFGGVPSGQKMLLIGADAATDLGSFDTGHVQIVQNGFADHQALKARGYEVVTAAAGQFDAAIVFLPRSRSAARARIAVRTAPG